MKDRINIDVSNINTSRIGRRSLIKRLLTAGFSTMTAITMTAEDIKAASKDEVPITYAMKSDDPLRTSYSPKKRLVPKDWYEKIQKVHIAHDEFPFEKIPGIVGTTIKPGEIETGIPEIQIEISPELAQKQGQGISKSRDMIPDEIGKTPTKIVKSKPANLGCYEKDYGSNPPVGCYVEGSKYSGSLGSPVYKNGEAYFSTNYHLFTDQNDLSGADLKNWNSENIGKVTDWDCTDDFVAVSPNSSYSVNDTLVNSDHYIQGYHTKDGIDLLASNNIYAEKRGKSTCHTSG